MTTRLASGLLSAFLLLLASCSVDFDELLAEGTSIYGRDKDEPILRHFFRDRRDGFFVDVGCWMPTQYSTTYYLEKELGWSGIGIDALPEMQPFWEAERPRSTFYWNAITDRSGDTIELFRAGAVSTTEVDILKKWEAATKRDLRSELVVVPTITLNDLLEAAGVEKIDFLSIDINGTEPAALAGFDIHRYRPELVHVEAHEKNWEALLAYFQARGYHRIDAYMPYDTINWWFTPNAEPSLSAAEAR